MNTFVVGDLLRVKKGQDGFNEYYFQESIFLLVNIFRNNQFVIRILTNPKNLERIKRNIDSKTLFTIDKSYLEKLTADDISYVNLEDLL